MELSLHMIFIWMSLMEKNIIKISFKIIICMIYVICTKDIIYVYPTPDNIGSIQFKDKADTCYGFRSKEVTCPKNQTKIRHYPVQ